MLKKYNFGDRNKKIEFKKPREKSFTNGCRHNIIICNGRTRLMPPSSSVTGTCKCIECEDTFEEEIGHLDYVCRNCKEYKNFSEMFEYDKEYTEYEVIDILVLNLKPDFILIGRNLKYGLVEFTDINGDELKDFMSVIWAHNTKEDGPELVGGVFVDGIVFALSNNRLVIREFKNITNEVKKLNYILKDSKPKTYYINLLHMMLDSKRVDESIRVKVNKYLRTLKL